MSAGSSSQSSLPLVDACIGTGDERSRSMDCARRAQHPHLPQPCATRPHTSACAAAGRWHTAAPRRQCDPMRLPPNSAPGQEEGLQPDAPPHEHVSTPRPRCSTSTASAARQSAQPSAVSGQRSRARARPGPRARLPRLRRQLVARLHAQAFPAGLLADGAGRAAVHPLAQHLLQVLGALRASRPLSSSRPGPRAQTLSHPTPPRRKCGGGSCCSPTPSASTTSSGPHAPRCHQASDRCNCSQAAAGTRLCRHHLRLRLPLALADTTL